MKHKKITKAIFKNSKHLPASWTVEISWKDYLGPKKWKNVNRMWIDDGHPDVYVWTSRYKRNEDTDLVKGTVEAHPKAQANSHFLKSFLRFVDVIL
jgi:hypothetical protein